MSSRSKTKLIDLKFPFFTFEKLTNNMFVLEVFEQTTELFG